MQKKKNKMKLESKRFTVTITGPMQEGMEEYRQDEAIRSTTAKLIQLAVVEMYGG